MEANVEFLVEFAVEVLPATSPADVEQRQRAEAVAATDLAAGHLVRLWQPPRPGEGTTAVGLFGADSAAQLHRPLGGLPLFDWLPFTVTQLEPDHRTARSGTTSTEVSCRAASRRWPGARLAHGCVP